MTNDHFFSLPQKSTWSIDCATNLCRHPSGLIAKISVLHNGRPHAMPINSADWLRSPNHPDRALANLHKLLDELEQLLKVHTPNNP